VEQGVACNTDTMDARLYWIYSYPRSWDVAVKVRFLLAVISTKEYQYFKDLLEETPSIAAESFFYKHLDL
jgi:5-bromo-4-chloroindolyl phosphate hydrolysis protein